MVEKMFGGSGGGLKDKIKKITGDNGDLIAGIKHETWIDRATTKILEGSSSQAVPAQYKTLQPLALEVINISLKTGESNLEVAIDGKLSNWEGNTPAQMSVLNISINGANINWSQDTSVTSQRIFSINDIQVSANSVLITVENATSDVLLLTINKK